MNVKSLVTRAVATLVVVDVVRIATAAVLDVIIAEEAGILLGDY